MRSDIVQQDAKYSKELEQGLQGWIESTTGMKIGDNFQAGIKNGVILCAFVSSSVRSSVLLCLRAFPGLDSRWISCLKADEQAAARPLPQGEHNLDTGLQGGGPSS
jgi:hypothetical protein